MSKPPGLFCLIKVVFFYVGGFIIPSEIKRDRVYFFTELFRGVHDAANKDSKSDNKALTVIEHQKEVQLRRPHIAKV